MKRKTSNILICVLAAIALGCAVMAIGTFGGWFGSEDTASEEITSEEAVTEETTGTEETVQAEDSAGNADKTGNPTCTICIKCSSVLKHMDNLASGKSKCVPSNGIILATSTIEFKDGESVYDILKRACSAAGIPISARSSSMGVYVEGINGLFEFDCGGTSGWMYSVNGKTPNHSCAEHTVKNGDKIVWHYTCEK
ncbi:MAG: DUF4430 domain-containing protein [Bacillota bacterium]|nr:DUF4430 domain-containing protein [Bacillota bacterium]